LREGHALGVFENWLLRKIFGPKGENVTAHRTKVPGKELHDLYSSTNIIHVIKSSKM
jgi:hypothetical protein